MKPCNIISIFITAVILAACTINVQLPSSSNPQQQAIATVVAQTMQAIQSQSTVEAPVNTPAGSSTPLATQIAVKALLTINQNTNCRSGPGQSFNLITAFTPGTLLEIVGKDSPDDFWLVTIPNTQDTCWASGQYATPSGSYASLPEITPTASTSNYVPAAPGSLLYSYSCASPTEATITLTWIDAADNESGYRVYRNGTLIAELPANSITYVDNTSRSTGSIFSYSVEAFNSIGASSQRTTGNFSLSGCANP